MLKVYSQGTLTPNAYGYAQYAATPVNYYNGLPQIGIPVTTMQDNGCTVPISLSYHASGIKVEQQASMVGLGWHLNVGGTITKVTMGKVDRECHYFDNNGESIYDLGDTQSYFWFWNFHATYFPNSINPDYASARNDCQDKLYTSVFEGKNMPDVYYFNFFGIAGQFVINYKTNTPIIYSLSSDVKFEPINGNYYESTGWKAITMNGSIFKFEAVETRELEGGGFGEYESKTFYLTSVQYPNGEIATFSYDNGSQVKSVYTYSRTNTKNIDDNIGGFYESKNRSTYTPKYLVEISTSTQKVTTEFFYSSRSDINGEKKLDAIMVQDNITNKKQYFDFTYSYFTESNTGGSYLYSSEQAEYTSNELSKRLKLVSFRQRGLPKYDFTYNSTQLPDKTSYARDYWGYYNGQNNTSLVPDISRITKFDDFYSDVPIFTSNTDNRGANPTYMKACILTSVKSPLGGITEYDYEAHTFDNYHYEAIGENWSSPGISKGGGLRIKNIIIKDKTGGNIVSEQNFQYGTPTNSYGKLMVRLRYISRYIKNGDHYWAITTNNNIAFSEHAQGSNVGYDQVTVYNYNDGNMGKLIYYYHNHANDILNNLRSFNMSTVNIPVFSNFMNGYMSRAQQFDALNNLKSDVSYEYSSTTSREVLGVVGIPTYSSQAYLIYYPADHAQIYLTGVTKKAYDDNGNQSTNSTNYEYNDIGQLIEIRENNAQPGKNLVTQFVYPYDDNPTVIEDYMVSDHNYTNLLKKTVKLGNELLSEEKITYNFVTYKGKRIFYPWSVRSTRGTDITTVINSVNSAGQIKETTNYKTGITTAFIRAYKNSLLVSAVTGSDYSTAVSYINDISNETSASAIRTEINKIRANLSESRVSTITYDSFAKKESETDANGKTIYYKYDSTGRLFRIVDQYGNVLKEMHYNVVKQ